MENMCMMSYDGFRVFLTFSLFHEYSLKIILEQPKTHHNPSPPIISIAVSKSSSNLVVS